MTLGEFRAWLDGFNAAIDGAPNPDQWTLIQEKLELVVADTQTPIISEPYWRRPPPTWPQWDITCVAQGTSDAVRLAVK